MPKRPPSDDEPLEVTQEQLDLVADHFKSLRDFEDAAIVAVFDALPKWLPEHVDRRLRQQITVLGVARQSPNRIAKLVSASDIEVPGSALEPIAFIDAVNDLAHIRWAIGLGKARGIQQLAGNGAAKDYLRNKAGLEQQFGTDEQRSARNTSILERASKMNADSPRLSTNDIAKRLAPHFDLSWKHIKKILKVANWKKVAHRAGGAT